MLHTKFHQNQSSVSWREDFKSVFTIYGHDSHLGHVTSIMLMIWKEFLKCFTIYGLSRHLGHVTSIILMNFHFIVFTSIHQKFG